ncbi:hypothetical protein ACROYT_G014899 [Oculina patagonica]
MNQRELALFLALYFYLLNLSAAIDGTHIKIKTPTESGPDYFSRLQQHDVVVQAVADGKKRFLDVAAGFPGSMHDSRVLGNSSLYQRITNNELLVGPTAGDLWDEDDDESDNDFPAIDGNADGADLRDLLREYLWNL